MRQVGAIAAMTRERVIGMENAIPWHYSEDFKRFKRVTLGGTLIMGRKTWESLGCKALPGRRNIVISRNPVADIEHFSSIERALDACRESEQDIWIIGGGQIYRAAMPYCTLLDITIVPDRIDTQGSIRFPKIDPEIWIATDPVPLQADPRLSIQRYTRRKP